MNLTSSQLVTLKNHILANTNEILYNGVNTAINVLPNNEDTTVEIAKWYNLIASPDFFVWKPSITRAEVYHQTGPSGSVWNWNTFKAQSVSEQNAWAQMFMGDSAPIALLNFREGCFNIFSGNAAQNNQRNHILAIGRRKATNIELLYDVAVAVTGGIDPDVDNGNVLGDTLGGASNPASLVFVGPVSVNDVSIARNLA